jgi:hypothetical protein
VSIPFSLATLSDRCVSLHYNDLRNISANQELCMHPLFRHHVRWLTVISLGTIVFCALLVIAFLTTSSTGVSAETEPPTTPIDNITLLRSDDDSLQLIVDVPTVRQSTAVVEGQRVTQLQIDGYVNDGLAGAPDLPQTSYWIAVPPGAVPKLTTVSSQVTSAENIVVQPTTSNELVAYDATDPDAVPEFNETVSFDRAVYNRDALTPVTSATLGDVLRVRDYQLVPLKIQPVQVNNGRQSAEFHDQIKLTITFEYPNGKQTVTEMRAENPVNLTSMSNSVVNFAAASDWRDRYQASDIAEPSPCLYNASNPNDATPRQNAHRVTLTETGLYAIKGSDIDGQPAINAIRMCSNESEIAIKVIDNGSDGVLHANDLVIFYGESIKTHDTEINAYWLTYGGADGERIQQVDGTPNGAPLVTEYPERIVIEDDISYFPAYPIDDPTDAHDHWFDQIFGYSPQNTSPSYIDKDFMLADKSSSSTQAHIELEVWGYSTYEQHAYQVEINGTQVGSVATFAGSARSGIFDVFSAEFDSSLLTNGSNTVTVRAIDNGSATNDGAHTMILNRIEITPYRQLVDIDNQLNITQPASGTWRYEPTGFSSTPLIFNVTDQDTPVEIDGTNSGAFEQSTIGEARFALATTSGLLKTDNSSMQVVKDSASNWYASTNSADLIIITDPSLENALNPLVTQRENQGHDVEVVFVQDIFDEFGYGRYDTTAIRNFLEHAYSAWSGTPPAYVLLAGDSTYDHRDLKGLILGRNLVPVYLRSGIDGNIGEAAADNQYVAFESDAFIDHNLPFMHLGRLPASNSAEMSTMVDKILTYESTANASWQGSHVFVADNGATDGNVRPPEVDGLPEGCDPDPAGDFHATADDFIATQLPVGQTAKRLYFAPSTTCYPDDEDHYLRGADLVGAATLQAFNDGAQHIIYTGHSAATQWAGERFLHTADVPLLTNAGRLPIMMPMTCLEGQNHLVNFSNGLSEALLKHNNGGAVASYAPTGLQVQTGHDFLLEGYYQATFEGQAIDLGSAIYQAKLALEANDSFGTYEDLHDTFVLLGDPSMPFNIWRPSAFNFLPSITTQ